MEISQTVAHFSLLFFFFYWHRCERVSYFCKRTALLWNSSSQKFTVGKTRSDPREVGMATVFSPPQHCSQPGTSYTTQIFSQSGLLPRSLSTSRRAGTLGREPPALFSPSRRVVIALKIWRCWMTIVTTLSKKIFEKLQFDVLLQGKYAVYVARLPNGWQILQDV